MRTHAYVVSSSNADYFAECAAISMTSLRAVHPDATIVAVIDAASGEGHGLDAIRGLADRCIDVTLGHDTALMRSRHLKVHLREIVEGDFLYLDSDTFVLRPIDPIWEAKADVAAAADLDDRGNRYVMSDAHRADFARLGWPDLEGTHLNSGVVLLRDTPAVHDLMRRLIDDWTHFCKVLGRVNDQPVFNHSVAESGISVALLPGIDNAQVSIDLLSGRNARIAHIFSGQFDRRDDTVLHVAARRLKAEGVVDRALIDRAIAAGHVWTHLDSPKKLFAAGKPIAAIRDLVMRRLSGRHGRRSTDARAEKPS